MTNRPRPLPIQMINKIDKAVDDVVALEEEIKQLLDDRQKMAEALCMIQNFGHTVGDPQAEARMVNLCLKINMPCFCGKHIKQPMEDKQ